MNIIKKLVVVIFMLILAYECVAADIICEYSYGNKQLEIDTYNDTIVHKKYTKNGLFYEYKIKDINNFNELDDYISISNSKGHRITYSLKCFNK